MATSSHYYNGPGPVTSVQGNARDITNKVNVYQRYTVSNPSRSERKEIYYNLKPPVTSFTGRHHELKELEKLLQHENEEASTSVAIIGIGGTGKTELARKYAHENSIYYTNIVWVDSETAANIQSAFESLAKDHLSIMEDRGNCRIEVTITKVYECLSESKTLFIFDNAEGYATIEGFLPPSIKGNIKNIHILFTSQIKEWEVMDENNIKKIYLSELLPEEAKEFVKKYLKQNDVRDEEIKKLIEELASFPLALTQAIAYINQQHRNRQKIRRNESYGIENYLKDFSDQPMALLDHGNTIHHRYANTVFKTLGLTFEKLSKEKNGQEAKDVITIIAYVAPDEIYIREMFAVDEDAFLLLDKYSLIKIINGVASIHRLLQQVIRLRNQDNEIESLRKALIAVKKLHNWSWSESYHCVWSYAIKHDEFIQAATYESTSTPLHSFVQYGNYEAAKVLLADPIARKWKNISNNDKNDSWDCDVDNICNQKDGYGYTPLLRAFCYENNLNMVKLLIENGSNVNAKNDNGETLLHLPSALDTKKFLIKSGSDINATDKDGITPLLAALYFDESFEIINFLILSGANVNATDKDGTTPLLLSIQDNKNFEIIKLLIESGANVNATYKYGTTPLLLAVEKNISFELIKLLIESGANVNATYEDGTTPLHFVAEYDSFEIIKLLIESRADVNATVEDGTTPLHYAAFSSGNVEIIKFMIASGADVNTTDKYGATLLHYAACNKNVDIIKFVLENGFDINVKDKNWNTPLHDVARSNRNVHAVKFLIERGANVNAVNKEGETILDQLGYYDGIIDEDLVKYMIEKGAVYNKR